MNALDRIIAKRASDGATNAEIAALIMRSVSTVELRLSLIYRELGIAGGAGSKKRRALAERLAEGSRNRNNRTGRQ